MAACSDVGDALDAGQRRVDPVVEALHRYQKDKGLFPSEIVELVQAGYLTQLPVLKKKRGSRDVAPLRYSVSPDREFYYLIFGYSANDLLGDFYGRYLISSEGQWHTRKYPPLMDDLVAAHYGKKYQHARDAASLEQAIRSLIAGAMRGTNCVHLYRPIVTNALGSSRVVDSIDIDGALLRHVDTYESTNSELAYGFTYKPMSSNTLVIKSDFASDPTCADVIIKGSRAETGQFEWSIFQKCK